MAWKAFFKCSWDHRDVFAFPPVCCNLLGYRPGKVSNQPCSGSGNTALATEGVVLVPVSFTGGRTVYNCGSASFCVITEAPTKEEIRLSRCILKGISLWMRTISQHQDVTLLSL